MCAQYFKGQADRYPIFQIVYDGLLQSGLTFPSKG